MPCAGTGGYRNTLLGKWAVACRRIRMLCNGVGGDSLGDYDVVVLEWMPGLQLREIRCF